MAVVPVSSTLTCSGERVGVLPTSWNWALSLVSKKNQKKEAGLVYAYNISAFSLQ